MPRVFNFNAGPAALPLPALERAQAELLDFKGSGMSIMEHSHRGKEYEAVHDEAISLVRELLVVPAEYEVLFLQGGASAQFAMLPMNFMTAGSRADYVLTGAWGEKALGEAKTVGALFGATAKTLATSGVGDGKEKSYTKALRELPQEAGAAYVHVTSNETIHGVQFAIEPGAQFPSAAAPLVVDMSSDIFWRKLDVTKFGMLYAGAQKNIGPSGVVLVIIRKDLVEKGRKDIPKIFQYRVHAENRSLYNTPPTFGVYLMRNTLSWMKDSGGLAAIEQQNRTKAQTLYAAIDSSNGYYKCPVDPGSRSTMNPVFRLPTEALEEAFVSGAKKAGMVGLKGHRSVGGIRASIYNAVSLQAVQALVSYMGEFAKKNG